MSGGRNKKLTFAEPHGPFASGTAVNDCGYRLLLTAYCFPDRKSVV